MKRFIILAILMLTIGSVSAQEKWRTITFTTVANAATQDNAFLSQGSVALDYELFDGFGISSWSGFAYNTLSDNSWFASQTTLDKRIGGFTIGMGFLYTSDANGPFVPVAESAGNELYVSLKMQYRIKL